MKHKLPEFDAVMDEARLGRAKVTGGEESRVSLADDVLRELRSSPDRRAGAHSEPIADWIRISKWAAAVGCALALAVATFSPKPPTTNDQPNALSALGGW